MKKKSIKPTYLDSNDHKKTRLCQEKGCLNEGEYMAPKSPNSKEKYFFCLDHIKIYNNFSMKRSGLRRIHLLLLLKVITRSTRDGRDASQIS